jgi:uncharacterized membrane-anchored protein
MRSLFIALMSLWCFGMSGNHAAAQNSGDHAAAQTSVADILKSLTYRHGAITLDNDLATINLTSDFVYIDGHDAETFLTRVWHNPPNAVSGTLGMILPTQANTVSPEGWGIVIGYDASGYVTDEDAENINYSELLHQMQDSIAEQSKERVAQGYQKYELVGWARPPYYDKAAKKLYWAKQLRFGDHNETLNYEIRILGRRGVLSLNAVASMSALAQIDKSAPGILAMVSFNQGNLYSEFNPSIDKAAAYGLAGLIAGGILTKTGIFGGLLALLLAFKKLVAVVVLGGLATMRGRIKALFGAKSKSSSPSPNV